MVKNLPWSKDSFKPDPKDIAIVVMGPTGSGKTNFINKITGKTEKRSASHLESDTVNVTPYPVRHEDLRLVLVDTPGFNDTNRPDSEILRLIADWLIQKYQNGTTLKIAGILYFHDISNTRMSGSACMNLDMFGRLCGDRPLPRTRLVTTMWDLERDQGLRVAEERQAELERTHWKPLIDGGAIPKRFHNSHGSAWDVVKGLFGQGTDDLLIQEELLEQQKHLNETEAGKALYNRLQKLLADKKRMLYELAEEARLENNPALAKELREEYDKIDAQLQETFKEIEDMRIPLSRRFYLWVFGQKSRGKAVKLGF